MGLTSLVEDGWFSKWSSESMTIPRKASALLEVVVVPPIDTTWGILDLSNKKHIPRLVFIWLLSNKL